MTGGGNKESVRETRSRARRTGLARPAPYDAELPKLLEAARFGSGRRRRVARDRVAEIVFYEAERAVANEASVLRVDAAEVLPVAFVRAFDYVIETFEPGRGTLRSYVYRVAGWQARDHLRRHRAQRRGEGIAPECFEELEDRIAESPGLYGDCPPGPEQLLMASEVMKIGESELPPLVTEIVERVLDGEQQKDIARDFGIDPAQVTRRVRKFLDKLEDVWGR